ncbi:MAG: hypothetical protein MHM6MM_006409 [Cercozoa sp. M6MM]
MSTSSVSNKSELLGKSLDDVMKEQRQKRTATRKVKQSQAPKKRAQKKTFAKPKPAVRKVTETVRVPSKKIIVSNLPKRMTDDDMRTIFSHGGLHLQRSILLRDGKGASINMGLLEYKTTRDAEKALAQFKEVTIEGVAVRLDSIGGRTIQMAKVVKQPMVKKMAPPKPKPTKKPVNNKKKPARPARKASPSVSLEELDKQLDAYNQQRSA